MEKLKITDGTSLEVNMVEVRKETKMETDEENTQRNKEQVNVAYPNNDESLVFLHCCQWKKSKVILYPKCSSVFDKKAAENIKRVQVASCIRNWNDACNDYTLTKWESLEGSNKEVQASRLT